VLREGVEEEEEEEEKEEEEEISAGDGSKAFVDMKNNIGATSFGVSPLPRAESDGSCDLPGREWTGGLVLQAGSGEVFSFPTENPARFSPLPLIYRRCTARFHHG
jgi:hypothetical protein